MNNGFTEQVTVTGNFTDGLKIKFNTFGSKSDILVDSSSLMNGAATVTVSVLTIKNGSTSSTAIPVADKQVVFIKIPKTGSRTFSGVGTSNTNYQVVDI